MLVGQGKGCFGFRIVAGVIEREVSSAGETKEAAILEEGMGLSPIVNPSFVGLAADHVGGSALVFHKKEIGPSEDPFV